MSDDYPSDEELKTIEDWPHTDIRNLIKYVKDLWHIPEWGWRETPSPEPEQGTIYLISTGGWSGNEDLIMALQKNLMFWPLCWYSSRRGGHFEFRVGENIQ
jgi:hypothetical protein